MAPRDAAHTGARAPSVARPAWGPCAENCASNERRARGMNSRVWDEGLHPSRPGGRDADAGGLWMALKIGVVGLAGIGNRHLQCYRESALGQVVAVCDSITSPARCRNPGRPKKAWTSVMSPHRYRMTLKGWVRKALTWK